MMMCLMLAGAMSFTACDGDDDLVTDQYAGGPVKLLAYGPNPVARMGELRILGVGLDQVQSVTIPGAGDITDINHISKEEIRITVPNEAVIGKIVLNTAVGQIESVTALKYTEPVGFDENCFSAPEIKPGETLTIKGEYLNLVQSVIFANGVEVDQITNTRKEIKVVVPYEAQTGRVAISFCATEDTIPNQIFSPVELKVTLPAVDEVANLTGKKPGDLITHKGSNLDLVTRLTVAGEEVDWWFTDDTKHDGIGYNLPESTPAQATVSIWPASGVECPIAYIGMVFPTELQATPATEVKPGDKIVISGKDLDVVTSAQFAGSAAPVEVTEQGTTKLTVEVPADAQSGDITLNCKSGATATVAIVTAKPVAESYNPSPVNAGNVVTINGKNLELVAKVVFADNLAVTDFLAQSSEALEVKVPATAVSGELTVTMKNGEQVTFMSLDINSPEFCFIPEMPNTSEMKAGDILSVNVVNGDKLIGVQIDGQDCQFILKEDMLFVLTPATAGMSSTLSLISSNGTIDYALAVIPSTEQTFVLWTGAADLNGWSWNWQIGDGTEGANNPQMFVEIGLQAGDVIRVWATNYNDWWQVQFFDGHWAGQTEIGNATGLNNGNNINSGIYDLAAHGGYIEIPVTATLAEQLTTLNDWGYCWIMQGEGVIISKIDVVRSISLETVLWEGELIADNWGNQPYALSDAGAELAEAGAKAGQTIRMYITPLDDIWQLEILEGHWGPWYCAFANQADDPKFTIWDLAAHNGAIEFKLTQEMLDAAYVQQWWGGVFVLNGDNVKVTKITIE